MIFFSSCPLLPLFHRRYEQVYYSYRHVMYDLPAKHGSKPPKHKHMKIPERLDVLISLSIISKGKVQASELKTKSSQLRANRVIPSFKGQPLAWHTRRVISSK